MSYYNSTNTEILATHTIENGSHPNTRMLLFHKFSDGRAEFVIGSYFTQEEHVEQQGPFEVVTEGIVDYSWDWGHYFGELIDAVDYWKREVLGL